MYKTCSRCKTPKLTIEFSKQKDTKDGLRSDCRQCKALKAKQYKVLNPDKIRETKRKWKRANPDKVAASKRRYIEKNPDKQAAQRKTRKCAELKRTPPWLTEQHKKEIRVVYRKAKEEQQATGVEYHVDHIVPLRGKTVCGLHVPWNLQVIPAKENIKKSNNWHA